MSLELTGTESVPNASVTPVTSPVPQTPATGVPAAPATPASPEVDHNGFTAEDRAEAARIYAETAPPVPPVAQPEGAGDTAPAEPTASAPAIDPHLASLAGLIGADLSTATDNAAAAANLANAIDIIAQYGAAELAAPAAPNAPPVPEPTNVQAPNLTALLEDSELGSVDPEVAAVLKTLNTKQASVLNKVLEEVAQIKSSLQEASNVRLNSQKAELARRAEAALDAFESDKFGKAGARNPLQKIAVEQVNRLAAQLIAGFSRVHGTTPTIEEVMAAAAARVGVLPKSKATPPAAPAPAPIPPLAPRQPSGPAPVATRRGVGSTGGGDALMSDPEYINAARAILGS